MTEKRFKLFDSNNMENVLHTFVVENGKSLTHKECCEMLNALHEENEQLKERNNRQSKRLAELYELMAKKDWESLTEIIDDFKRCEEQLQRESGAYGDVE